jgi:hypothetical protein
MAIEPHPIETLPEAPAPMLGHETLEDVDHRRVPHRRIDRRVVPGRPRQSGDAAGATDRERMLRRQGDYPQYVVREYPVYRMFSVLTPRSFRARLADIKYVDAASRKTIEVRTGLFLEDDDDVARRLEGRVSDTTVFAFDGMDRATSTLMMLFEYMIGNTDLSIRAMHNVRIVLTPSGMRYPIPYDFDYSGVVDAVYAAPSPFLRSIESVRERVYLGPCRTPAELEAVYSSIPALKPKYVSAAKKYLEQFYRTIERPDSVKHAFIDGCEKQPYM